MMNLGFKNNIICAVSDISASINLMLAVPFWSYIYPVNNVRYKIFHSEKMS